MLYTGGVYVSIELAISVIMSSLDLPAPLAALGWIEITVSKSALVEF